MKISYNLLLYFSQLLLYSSNNIVSRNNVNVTSKLSQQQSTTGNKSSQNSIVGIDLYFNSHNNTFSNNKVYVKSKDNYIYGMGVLGYYTGHNAPKGQGATNNSFIKNQIALEGVYCVEGIIIGFVGAVIPIGVLYVMYNKVVEYVVSSYGTIAGFIKFLPVQDVFVQLLPVALFLGMGVGFVGSMVTVRKHLSI